MAFFIFEGVILMSDIREGDLFKIINVSDHIFEIRYGYYDDAERYSRFNEPIPIYPDFISEPKYTSDGFYIVTQIQDKCEHYKSRQDLDICFKCKHFKEVEDLIGICTCLENKNKEV